MHSRANFLIMFFCTWFLVGCGKSDSDLLDQYYEDRQEVVALSGQITVDGKGIKDLSLRLVPLDSKELGAKEPKTLTDEEGLLSSPLTWKAMASRKENIDHWWNN